VVCHHGKLPTIQVWSKIAHSPHDDRKLLCTIIFLGLIQGAVGKSYRAISSCDSTVPRPSPLASVRMKDWSKSGYFRSGSVINFPFKV